MRSLLIGANPRVEAPVLNARIRKAWLASRLPIGVIGDQADLSYGYHYLGAGGETLKPDVRRNPQIRQGAGRRETPD